MATRTVDWYPSEWENGQTVTNAGTLEGHGTAVDLGKSDDTLSLEPTSVILGDIDGGSDTDTLAMGFVGGGRIDGDVRSFETLRIEGGAEAANAVADLLIVSGGIADSFETVEIEEAGGRISSAFTFSDNTLSLSTVSPANLNASVDVGLGNGYLFLDTLGSRMRGPALVGDPSAPLADAPSEPISASSRATATLFAADAARIDEPAVWGEFLGRRGEREDDDGVAGNDYRLGGVALGMDGRLPDRDMRLGWGFAYSQGDYDINEGGGSGDTENFMLGAYLGLNHGRYFADFALAGGYNRYDNRRRVTVNGGHVTAKSDYDGYTLAARAAGGANWDYEGVRLQALGTLDWVLLDQGGYEESGAGAANLQVDDTTARALRLAVELGAARDFSVLSGVLTPELRLGVVREIALDDRAVDASMPGFGPAFPIQGNSDDETRGLVRAALTFWDHSNLSASLAYRGEFGDTTSTQSLTAGLRYNF